MGGEETNHNEESRTATRGDERKTWRKKSRLEEEKERRIPQNKITLEIGSGEHTSVARYISDSAPLLQARRINKIISWQPDFRTDQVPQGRLEIPLKNVYEIYNLGM
jgi:hypothetical protein